MGDGQSTCRRVGCQTRIDPEWSPWCGEDDYRVDTAVTAVPRAARTHPLSRGAAVRHAFPWLDVRSTET